MQHLEDSDFSAEEKAMLAPIGVMVQTGCIEPIVTDTRGQRNEVNMETGGFSVDFKFTPAMLQATTQEQRQAYLDFMPTMLARLLGKGGRHVDDDSAHYAYTVLGVTDPETLEDNFVMMPKRDKLKPDDGYHLSLVGEEIINFYNNDIVPMHKTPRVLVDRADPRGNSYWLKINTGDLSPSDNDARTQRKGACDFVCQALADMAGMKEEDLRQGGETLRGGKYQIKITPPEGSEIHNMLHAIMERQKELGYGSRGATRT